MAEQDPSSPVLEPPDPFQQLHKMSTTAGVGAGDYVAISGTAVATVLLGLASLTVLFGSPFLLVVPVVAVGVAVLAFVRIARSNGTQSGRLLVVVGLLLAVGLGLYQGGRTLKGYTQGKADENQVVALVHGFGQDVTAGRIGQAYDKCDDDFHAQVSREAFAALWESMRSHRVMGQLTSIEWNGSLQFGSDPTRDQPVASGMVFVQFDKSSEPARTDMFFRRVGGRWLIDRLPQFFPPPAAPTAAKPGAGRASQRLGPPKPG